MGWFILIVNILLIFKLWWDWRQKNIKKRIINHSLSAGIDVLIYAVSAWFIFGKDFWGFVLLATSYRWIMFDTFFNLLNGDKWNHYGKSSRIDRFMTSVGAWHIFIKLGVFIGSILILHFIKGVS